MFLFKTVDKLQAHLDDKRSEGLEIGFIPTLGALHEGHGSLIRHSIKEGLYTVVSIYVNPTQFNDPEDLEKYPKPIKEDLNYLHELTADVVFLPSDETIYPEDRSDIPHVHLGHLNTTLEAVHRPGHFEGVLQVVHRLLEIVEADHLFMGTKDLQQLIIIRELIRQLNIPVQLVGLPIVRDTNGLARSSRNERLSGENRKKAAIIFEVMNMIAKKYPATSIEELKEKAFTKLNQPPFRPEYFEFVRSDNLEILDSKEQYSGPVSIVTAVWCDEIRLIDNLVVDA